MTSRLGLVRLVVCSRDLPRLYANLRKTLRLLRRLMDGEQLTVTELVKQGGFRDDAVRRWLPLEAEIPGVQRVGRRGQRCQYRAPGDASPDGFSVLSVALGSTLLSSLRGSEINARRRRLFTLELNRVEGSHTPGDLSRMFFAPLPAAYSIDLERSFRGR